jgi:hypothetical protein
MEWTMHTGQQGSGAGTAPESDATMGFTAGSSEGSDAIHTAIVGETPFLPAPRRWVPHRKAEVVAAVRGGLMSLDEARKRYALSIDEYLSWQREIDLYGLAGLRVNRTQKRRRGGPPPVGR